ncbi:hypothetical protein DS2_09592 [Catenovulum agarivorans DS-2]|uniref:Lipid/polyisoprenoid-binding YceI-like domain-containing protein n=1 Tax=Catenovulum agarivorans DS-2 TaxID=1328313 RepID=W7QXM0_9ALTE|nr:YceI family protein [Catenovulum agarivorans]EWH10035.1 hypothetical protein DS2_09592 [Catenovulum agarivorans DS-2]
MTLRKLVAMATLGCSLLANTAFAGWKLDEQASKLTFLSTKKSQVVEQHTFKQVSGTFADSGKVTVAIKLDSVETNIPIRNERMQKYLFETEQYVYATISTQLNAQQFKQLPAGAYQTLQVEAQLDLHGHKQQIQLPINVIKGNNGQLFVNSVGAVVINAADFALVEGINKLQSLAGLPSITYSVPVSFNLVFAAE